MNKDQLIGDVVKRVTVFDLSNDEVMFMATQVTDATIEATSDSQDVTGMNGIVISKLDRTKGASLSFTNGLIVINGFAQQVGAVAEDASEDDTITTPIVDLVTLGTATTATLSYTPVDATSIKVYKVAKTGGQGDALVLSDTAATGKFSIAGNVLTFADGELAKGDSVYAIYEYAATVGKKITNRSDVFTKNVKIIADIIVRDVCDDTPYVSHLVMPRAKIDGNFSLALGNDAATHEFKADALPDLCSATNELFSWYVCE